MLACPMSCLPCIEASHVSWESWQRKRLCAQGGWETVWIVVPAAAAMDGQENNAAGVLRSIMHGCPAQLHKQSCIGLSSAGWRRIGEVGATQHQMLCALQAQHK